MPKFEVYLVSQDGNDNEAWITVEAADEKEAKKKAMVEEKAAYRVAGMHVNFRTKSVKRIEE